MSFSLLFKLEIDNEMNDMAMELLESLIGWVKNYYWKDWHSYMSIPWLIIMRVLFMKSFVKRCDMVICHFFYKDIKIKGLKWIICGDPRLLNPQTPFKPMYFYFFHSYEL